KLRERSMGAENVPSPLPNIMELLLVKGTSALPSPLKSPVKNGGLPDAKGTVGGGEGTIEDATVNLPVPVPNRSCNPEGETPVARSGIASPLKSPRRMPEPALLTR